MNFVDIIILVVLLFGAIKGYLRGFIVEVFSFFAFFIGLFLAIELTIPLSTRYFADNNFFQLIAVGVFIALFLLVMLVVNIAAKTLKKAVDLTFFGWLDNILGSLAAIFKWAFIMSILLWIFASIGFRLSAGQMEGSFMYPVIQVIGPAVFEWLSGMLPFIKDMMDSIEDIGEKQEGVYTFL